jgi:hypothetical protein
MSTLKVYQRINRFLASYLMGEIGHRSLKRVSLLVTGIVKGLSAAPAQLAEALSEMNLSPAQAESIERRIRRVENDPVIEVRRCFHPLVKAILQRSRIPELVLILDPTTQKDHLVMVSVNAWYRGRSLPLAWTVWPGNVPLEGGSFWERMAALLAEVAELLPGGIPVILLADRAFGTPMFTDLATQLGWHWIVRVQDQTLYRDACGRVGSIASLVPQRGHRKKLAGQAFKKAGWRPASVIVFWGVHHPKPLCLVSDLRPAWNLVYLYRRRFPIECTFRDYKSYGWHWEQGQVRNLEHVQRLLVGIALAAWMTLMLGAQFASSLLAATPSGARRTRPWWSKKSLFRLGLMCWKKWFQGTLTIEFPQDLPDWDAPNWSTQIYFFHARAFVFAPIDPLNLFSVC